MVSVIGIICSIPGQTIGISIFTEILMEELRLSRLDLSTAYFIGTVVSGLCLPWAGRLFDRVGARRMVVLAAALSGLVLFYLSAVADLLEFFSGGRDRAWVAAVAIGLGFFLIRFSAQGVLTMSCRNVVGKWFDEWRGLVMAFTGIFVSFGFAIAPQALNILVRSVGYEWAWQLLGAALLLVLVPLGWAFVPDNPEECGLKMDGGRLPQRKRVNPDMKLVRELNRQEALRTWSFHAFNFSFAFFALYSTAFTFHIESIGLEAGFELTKMVSFFLPMAVISVATNLVCGAINARIRLKWLLFAMNLAAVLGAVGLLRVGAEWGTIAYVVGNGISGGIFANVSGLVWPRFFGRTHLGAISGLAMSSMVIGSGLGPWVFALLHRLSGSYETVLAASIVVPTILCLASLMADNPQRQL